MTIITFILEKHVNKILEKAESSRNKSGSLGTHFKVYYYLEFTRWLFLPGWLKVVRTELL